MADKIAGNITNRRLLLSGPEAGNFNSGNIKWYPFEFRGNMNDANDFLLILDNQIKTNPFMGIYKYFVANNTIYIQMERNQQVRNFFNSELSGSSFYKKETGTSEAVGPTAINPEILKEYGYLSSDEVLPVKDCFSKDLNKIESPDEARDAIQTINENQLKLVSYVQILLNDIKPTVLTENESSCILNMNIGNLCGVIPEQQLMEILGKGINLEISDIEIVGTISKENTEISVPNIFTNEFLNTIKIIVENEIEKDIENESKGYSYSEEDVIGKKKQKEDKHQNESYFDWLERDRQKKQQNKNSYSKYIIVKYAVSSEGHGEVSSEEIHVPSSNTDSTFSTEFNEPTKEQSNEIIQEQGEEQVYPIEERPKDFDYTFLIGNDGLIKIQVQYTYNGINKEFKFDIGDLKHNFLNPDGIVKIIEEFRKLADTKLKDIQFAEAMFDTNSSDESHILSLTKYIQYYDIYNIDIEAIENSYSSKAILERRHKQREQ